MEKSVKNRIVIIKNTKYNYVSISLNEYLKKDTVLSDNRSEFKINDNVNVIQDSYSNGDICCSFIRVDSNTNAKLILNGEYQISKCMSGGWIFYNKIDKGYFWMPVPPVQRTLNNNQQVLSEEELSPIDYSIDTNSFNVEFIVGESKVLDLVFWYFSSNQSEYIREITNLVTIELQSYFIYASHSTYSKPADLYKHLINGYIYEQIWSWPNKWKIFDELDAYALYLVISGLEKSTGKRFYSFLKQQIIQSVISRQSKDGGFYHGEWTENMESHYRLHAGAILLLAMAVEEYRNQDYTNALIKATDFLARKTDKLPGGTWLLHDSLESSSETIKQSPFKWKKSKVFGKSISNMMVLNTHLDSCIAIGRSQYILQKSNYKELMISAKAITRKVIENRPAEILYILLFRMIGLTFLPKKKAMQLSFPVRVIKRLTWKYLFNYLCHIKAIFPRFIMPGGYIDRDISLKNFSQYYQSVNVWDIIRFRCFFSETYLDQVIDDSLNFTYESGIRELWIEGKRMDALAFWSEALYRMCLLTSGKKYRAWLAESVLDTESIGLGISPSLLGCNSEAVPFEEQHGTILIANENLRVLNLCNGNNCEYILVNSSLEEQTINLEQNEHNLLNWTIGVNGKITSTVPAKGWVHVFKKLSNGNENL